MQKLTEILGHVLGRELYVEIHESILSWFIVI
jgi:hypothetical protein